MMQKTLLGLRNFLHVRKRLLEKTPGGRVFQVTDDNDTAPLNIGVHLAHEIQVACSNILETIYFTIYLLLHWKYCTVNGVCVLRAPGCFS